MPQRQKLSSRGALRLTQAREWFILFSLESKPLRRRDAVKLAGGLAGALQLRQSNERVWTICPTLNEASGESVNRRGTWRDRFRRTAAGSERGVVRLTRRCSSRSAPVSGRRRVRLRSRTEPQRPHPCPHLIAGRRIGRQDGRRSSGCCAPISSAAT
jgi:hypothetical protein